MSVSYPGTSRKPLCFHSLLWAEVDSTTYLVLPQLVGERKSELGHWKQSLFSPEVAQGWVLYRNHHVMLLIIPSLTNTPQSLYNTSWGLICPQEERSCNCSLPMPSGACYFTGTSSFTQNGWICWVWFVTGRKEFCFASILPEFMWHNEESFQSLSWVPGEKPQTLGLSWEIGEPLLFFGPRSLFLGYEVTLGWLFYSYAKQMTQDRVSSCHKDRPCD